MTSPLCLCCLISRTSTYCMSMEVSLSKIINTQLQGFCNEKTKGFGSSLTPHTTLTRFDHSGDNDNYEVFRRFEVVRWGLTEIIYRQLLKVILRTIQGLPDSICTHTTDEWNMQQHVRSCILLHNGKCVHPKYFGKCYVMLWIYTISRGFPLNKQVSSL